MGIILGPTPSLSFIFIIKSTHRDITHSADGNFPGAAVWDARHFP